MKKRIWLIMAAIVIALIICLLIWRFYPQSSSSLMPIDKNTVTDLSAIAYILRFGDTQTHSDTYRIDNPYPQSTELGEIIEILATSNYQQDFRNLLPWGIDTVDSDKNYDGRTVTLIFFFQNAENEYMEIMFQSNSLMWIRTEEHPNLRIYHPTNSATLDKLVEYLQTHGVKQ